jgi:hypothetical protein
VSTKRLISIVSILLFSSCVDRIFYDIDLPQGLPIAVYGYISNKPGPYKVSINTSFDIESKENRKAPVSARHVKLMDELGGTEELSEVKPGEYQTSPTGMQGRIGGVYKLRIEFQDGKIYESIPDTLLSPGTIDTLYQKFKSAPNLSGATQYGFDLIINARSNSKINRFMWNFTGTFKALTHPELITSGCYYIDGRCNFVPLCTGLLNISLTATGKLYKRIGPCTCCTCWYEIFNEVPILSDEIYDSRFNTGMSVYEIPLDPWIFMYKIHAEVSQLTLTKNTFHFFKSISNQKTALGSLFQPITGKIPNTFIQLEGTPTAMNGIFHASGIDSKSVWISRDDVRKGVEVSTYPYEETSAKKSCFDLFPNATNVKPDFWID